MTCYKPLKGWRSRQTTENGKRKIVFVKQHGYADLPVTLPCGQCIGCRLERSRQWAIRCTHEAQLHTENSYITLTYNDANIPHDGSLDLRHYQLFMKRLRKYFYPKKIRYFHCGEYGDQDQRPHYHACLFGIDFADKWLWKLHNKNKLYRSTILENLWVNENKESMGYSTIGAVTFESAAYVARYIMKKMSGPAAADHYTRYHSETGEIHEVAPEYTTMSRRPGLGSAWLEEFNDDIYPDDFVIIRGQKMRPPKFYDKQLEKAAAEAHAKIRGQRIRAAKKHVDDQTPARLKVREKCKEAQASRLVRNLE